MASIFASSRSSGSSRGDSHGVGLAQALESISEGFALFDPEDRLVLSNRKFRETFPAIAELIQPGISFETYLRAVPGDLQAQALLASAHMAQGRYARATQIMQVALRNSDSPQLRTVLGMSLSGAGRIQREGEQVQEIRAGDTVIIPPGVRHWHGAAPDTLFSHLAFPNMLFSPIPFGFR